MIKDESITKFHDIDSYIAFQQENIRPTLEKLRQTIRKAVPEAEEVISYQMPAFKQGSILVWYAAFKKHVGLFPKTSVMAEFKDKLAQYKTSKGTIQFPYDKPLPLDLIKKIVQFRLKEAAQKP